METPLIVVNVNEGTFDVLEGTSDETARMLRETEDRSPVVERSTGLTPAPQA